MFLSQQLHWSKVGKEIVGLNTLGVSNTLLQRVTNVGRYMRAYNKYRDDHNNFIDSDQLLETWDWVRAQTAIYEAEITWKKAIICYNTMTSNYVDGVSIFAICTEMWSKSVDVLTLQSDEKTRNLMKYVAELCSRILPTRFAEQRGLCKKYPALFVEAFRLSMPTTDGNPQVLMTDATMSQINSTIEYVGSGNPHEHTWMRSLDKNSFKD